MNFKENTGKDIQEAFEEFHKLNPSVYEHFKRIALEAINSGKKKFSAKLICGKIRWDVFMMTEEPTLFNQNGKMKKFKINDAYTSRYARLFGDDFPEHEKCIEYRELRS